jgi:phosphohistidine swiveling domain-containing protein
MLQGDGRSPTTESHHKEETMTVMQRTTEPTATLHWEAPGPGFWRQDDSHDPNVVTRYFIEFITELASNPESWKGFRDYGLLVASLDFRPVNRYLYLRPRIAAAPEKPSSGSPPPVLLKLLFALHPELRYRKRRAALVFATKRWRQDRLRWQQDLGPRLRERLLALQQVDPTTLDDAALRAHLLAMRTALIEGSQLHAHLLPADMIPVGDWLWHTCAWTGATPAEAMGVLTGKAQGAVAPLTLLDHLAQVMRRTPAAQELLQERHLEAADCLERLRASDPAVAGALEAYLTDYGHRLVTGYDVCDLTLRELPQVLLRSLAAKVDGQATAQVGMEAEQVSAQLRSRVPASARAEYDARLSEACCAFGLQEDNVGITAYWPAGLMRRAILAAGERLVAHGRIEQPDHLVEALSGEIDALLGGPGTAPAGDELARRAQERRLLQAEHPPAALGEPEAPPPAGLLPPVLERVTQAMLCYLLSLDADPTKRAQATNETLSGLGVSRGTYTGRARVVRSATDFEKVQAGDILVALVTSSGYNVLLPLLGAIVTDRGGVLCHTAIVAREFGIPAVVGTGEATARIADGARIRVDGTNGTVAILAGDC